MTHELITGPNIQGRIPHGDGFVDVTPEVLFFETPEEAAEVADSIEVEHAIRGTHPIQDECPVLSDAEVHPGGLSLDPEVIKAHQAAHKALNKKAGL
jgi:hypothetical protein